LYIDASVPRLLAQAALRFLLVILSSKVRIMIGTSVLLLALAATGLAQAPEGYRKVIITSNVNTKFVMVPKARTSGSTTIVYVPPHDIRSILL
jgi:hypothetical protein